MSSKRKTNEAPKKRAQFIEKRSSDGELLAVIKNDVKLVYSVGRKAVKSVSVAATRGLGTMAFVPYDSPTRLSGPPDEWPASQVWQPDRYFGSFRKLFGLEEIEIQVFGPSAHWYYNNYFTDHPISQDRYRPFYPSTLFPPRDPAPVSFTNPGNVPAFDGAGRFVFVLDRMEYSSLFGGTVKLVFLVKSDVGFEVRGGDFIWDIKDMELHVHVTPTCGLLTNPNPNTKMDVTCVISFGDAFCYSVPSQSLTTTTTPQLLPDSHQEELTEALGVISDQIKGHIEWEASRFVGGLLWDVHSDAFGPAKVVEGIEISDNYFFPHTREGVPIVSVWFRVSTILRDYDEGFWKWVFGASEGEYKLTLYSYHWYQGGYVRGPTRKCKMSDDLDEPTPWVFVGAWRFLDEFPYVQSITLCAGGVETDWPDSDDVLNSGQVQIHLDRTEIEAAYDADDYGVVSVVGWGTIGEDPGFEVRVSLIKA